MLFSVSSLYSDFDSKEISLQGPWYIHLYALLPLRYTSHIWGKINDYNLPEWIKSPLFRSYSYLFNVNLDEVENIYQYKNLGEFFYRQLKPKSRVIDPGDLVSPSDGRILHVGKVENGQIEHVKNVRYSVDALLGSSTNKQLHYMVIYLAPGDYHRFHSPTYLAIQEARHFCGQLYSVSPKIFTILKNLFILNERVVLMGQWKHGFFSMIPVGATNVGRIILNDFPDIVTNSWEQKPETNQFGKFNQYNKSLEYEKGQEMGGFKLGSTVILVFEMEKEFEFLVKEKDRVKMGQKLIEIKEN